MRHRIGMKKLGLGFTLFTTSWLSQAAEPGTTKPPRAARLIAVQALDPQQTAPNVLSTQGVVRSQMPDPMQPLGAPRPMAPMPSQPNPMGQPPAGGTVPGAQLGTPRAFGSGPAVTEQRLQPGQTIPPPTMYPGVPVAPGAPVGMGYPVAGPVVGMPMGQGGLFSGPALDAPLYAGAGPLFTPGATSAYDKWYLSAEYLLWWTKGTPNPPLLTTSSPQSNGILGNPDTRVLVGNGSFNQNLHSGARFTLGHWFGCDQRWGAEGSVFFLGTNGQTFATNSGVYPVLARPFVNLNQNIPFSQLISSPGLASGGVEIETTTAVWGAEANIRRYLAKTGCARLDLIGGFRFMQLNEELNVTEYFSRSPGSPTSVGVPTASSGVVQDQFRTENDFYGGQLGLVGEVRRGRWFSTLTGKVALGTVFQSSTIMGQQNIRYVDGSALSFPGGLLAVPGANMGTVTQSKFAVIPEVGWNIGYHVTPHMRIFFGYNFMYLNSVLRPGNQIDGGLDVTRIPNFPVEGVTPLPQTRPVQTFKDSDFFAQGLNFGIQFNW